MPHCIVEQAMVRTDFDRPGREKRFQSPCWRCNDTTITGMMRHTAWVTVRGVFPGMGMGGTRQKEVRVKIVIGAERPNRMFTPLIEEFPQVEFVTPDTPEEEKAGMR